MGEYKRQDYIWKMKVKENIYGDQFFGVVTSFDITVPQMPRYIKNCSIGQFFFRNLITMNDFYITATKLNKSMGWYDASVAAVVYQGEIVAAIHVFEGKVLFIITDKRMKENTPLYNAMKKWSEKYNLKFDYSK